MVKIIIAGSRSFENYPLLEQTLDEFIASLDPKKSVEIVSGGARGADRLGEKYARSRCYALKIFPANWDFYGKRAGYIRNAEMAEYADCLVAFWDCQSRGTQHMINLAIQKGLKICCINF